MAGRVIRITEAEAASDFAGLLARVRAGAEVVIEKGNLPVAVVRPAEPHVRLLSESLRLAKEHASTATADAGCPILAANTPPRSRKLRSGGLAQPFAHSNLAAAPSLSRFWRQGGEFDFL